MQDEDIESKGKRHGRDTGDNDDTSPCDEAIARRVGNHKGDGGEEIEDARIFIISDVGRYLWRLRALGNRHVKIGEKQPLFVHFEIFC